MPYFCPKFCLNDPWETPPLLGGEAVFGMGESMKNLAPAFVPERFRTALSRFRQEERGAMAIFMVMIFFLMLVFGGIAVDVMRFETRRVTLQQTMDRAALAAASLTQTKDGKVIAEDWFDKAGLNDENMLMVDFSDPVVKDINFDDFRSTTVDATVRSNNFFMHWLGVDYLEGPARSEAGQGVSKIEVMMVLDISGSMGELAAAGDTKTKIEALRESAEYFVTVVKEADVKNQVSIGIVPYNGQVNVPANLRAQFTSVTNLSHWGGSANQGVPNINCLEIPTSTYNTTGLSTTTSMRMAAVADTAKVVVADVRQDMPTDLGYLPAANYTPSTNPLDRICNTIPDDPGTAHNEATANHVMLPTKTAADVITRIQNLAAGGYTSIAIGMRWGTALIDETARPIYTAIGDPSVAGRPDNNISPVNASNEERTRKIIILMTDGEHVATNHIKDAYKSGASPIYLGSDGNYAIRFWSAGTDLHDNSRSNNCQGTNLRNSVNVGGVNRFREYFVPHLKTGTTDTCVLDAWKFDPKWTYTIPDGPDADTLPDVVQVTGVQLDWSEVWARLPLNYVTRQFYARSNVSSVTHSAALSQFRQGYINASTLDTLLQQNCTAAKNQDIEVYGIAFAAPAGGQVQIEACASRDENGSSDSFYFNAANEVALQAAFRSIVRQLDELRLTQ
jgi:Flp pilus assembly protein TadG